MALTVVARKTMTAGVPLVVDGPAPGSAYGVVFEDDGSTGYFYALDPSRGDNPIVDALHIYNVASVSDKHLPSEVVIAWSSDSQKAFLFINRCPNAVFDFEARRGYCRSGFPPPDGDWTVHSHDWSDTAMELLK